MVDWTRQLRQTKAGTTLNMPKSRVKRGVSAPVTGGSSLTWLSRCGWGSHLFQGNMTETPHLKPRSQSPQLCPCDNPCHPSVRTCLTGNIILSCKGTVVVPVRHKTISALLSGGNKHLTQPAVAQLDFGPTQHMPLLRDERREATISWSLVRKGVKPGVLSPYLTHMVTN